MSGVIIFITEDLEEIQDVPEGSSLLFLIILVFRFLSLFGLSYSFQSNM